MRSGHAMALAWMAGLWVPAAAAAQDGRSGLDRIGQMESVVRAADAAFHHQRLRSGLQFTLNGVTKSVIFYTPDIVRVNANLGASYWRHPSLTVIASPQTVPFSVREAADTLELVGQKLRVSIAKATGAVTFLDTTGRVMTREAADPQSITRRTISAAPTYEVENRFTLKPGEGIYGFGFTGDEDVNRRGKDLLLVQTNIGIIIPVMVSTERYGILWDTYSEMRFRDGPAGASLWAESAPGGVDYYFMAGADMDGVVADYRWLTGKAPMYPKQAFGLFMSKERYPTQARLLEVARAFRADRFPLDYIVQDWQYWGSDTDGSWSGMIWDPKRFPDPAGMTKAIHDLHMKLMISIWPSVGNDTALGRELDRYKLRFAPLHWISKKARIYDAYSPLGRQIYFKHIKSGLLDNGVDALWMDGTEVEVGSAAHDAQENIRDIKGLGTNALGDFTRYLNPYTLMTTQGTYDGQRATSDKRVFTLTRSAWAGAQRTGAASWSGDTSASWRTLRQQIAGGVNVTVTGNPYWTQDTGGFFVNEFSGGEKNAAWRELYARWAQYAAFNPIMRIHGTSVEREPYIFREIDPAVYRSLLGSVQLRYRLLPYIYSLSAKVTADGYTLMRPLAMDFPNDAATFDRNDSFMFGPSLLVAPVTHAMYNLVDPPAEAIPTSALRTPDGKPGLQVTYYAGADFDRKTGTAIDAKVDHDWPGPPLAEIPGGLPALSDFSAKWEGEVIAPVAGEYELGVSADDGARLFLNDEKVTDDWASGAERYHGVRRVLKQGEHIRVRIEYHQGGGERALRLRWRTPADLKLLDSRPKQDLAVTTYLPRGADWYDFWTNARQPGGREVTQQAPLDRFPLYVRAGSIMPMGPVLQYATEQPDAAYEIRIYPGADGRFTIYEDDNETYAYEKGQSARYDIRWDDRRRTVTVGARSGTFPGMMKQRRLNFVIAAPANAGPEGGARVDRSIVYDGRPMTISFAP